MQVEIWQACGFDLNKRFLWFKQNVLLQKKIIQEFWKQHVVQRTRLWLYWVCLILFWICLPNFIMTLSFVFPHSHPNCILIRLYTLCLIWTNTRQSRVHLLPLRCSNLYYRPSILFWKNALFCSLHVHSITGSAQSNEQCGFVCRFKQRRSIPKFVKTNRSPKWIKISPVEGMKHI